jgi:alpha-glucosidase (family GH31 glycosyl hydrolase)
MLIFFWVDQGTPYDTNLYGTHPMYMEIRQSQTLGLAHGVFFLNTNAMNVHLQSGAMTFQTSGGVIDIFIVLGPSPHQVIQQYTSIVGRPHFPPFWEFGFHQCRWGYQSIQETASVALNYKRFLIPLDTMWNDIDYMDGYRDFTHDPVYYPTESVAQFVEYLHNNHQQYVVILDPGIMIDPNYFSYVQGLAEDVFIKESTGTKNLVGTVWPGNTVFPDFSNPKTTPYWKSQIAQFRSTGVSVDGLWIDMNEISNFCNGECVITNPDQYTLQNDPYDNPPWYPTAQPLNTSTISMNALTYAGVNYNTHDLYAFFEACGMCFVLFLFSFLFFSFVLFCVVFLLFDYLI